MDKVAVANRCLAQDFACGIKYSNHCSSWCPVRQRYLLRREDERVPLDLDRQIPQPPEIRRERLRHIFGLIGSGLVGSTDLHSSGRGAARAEDAQGTPTQSHISPSILVYEDYGFKSSGSGFRVQGSGFGVWGLGFRVVQPPEIQKKGLLQASNIRAQG